MNSYIERKEPSLLKIACMGIDKEYLECLVIARMRNAIRTYKEITG